MNSIHICSIYGPKRMPFLSSLCLFSRFRGLKHKRGSNTFASDSTGIVIMYEIEPLISPDSGHRPL